MAGRTAQQPDDQRQADDQAEAGRNAGKGLAGGVLPLARPAMQRPGGGDADQERHAHPLVQRVGERHRKVEAPVGQEDAAPQGAERLARAGKGLADQLVEEEQPQQQRHVAEGLDVPGADPRQQPVVRQAPDAEQRAQHRGHEDAEHRDLQRVEHADQDGAAVGAGRRVGDHGVADLEARFAFEIVEAAGDLLALQVVHGVGDEIPGEQADQPHDHDLENPAADDGIIPGRHLGAWPGAQCLDGHPLCPPAGRRFTASFCRSVLRAV